MAKVRLLPALIATAGVVLALKAVAVAEAASDVVPADATAAPGPAPEPVKKVETAQCPPPDFASQAGLSATEVEVLQSLGARRTALDQRSADIDTQAALLEATEKRVNDRLAELKRVEASVSISLAKLDTAQDARVTAMVNVYQKMKSKDAADIFNSLDDDALLDVASQMKQANLAEIMGLMQPERARKLTTMLLKRGAVPADILAKAPAAAPATPAKPAA